MSDLMTRMHQTILRCSIVCFVKYSNQQLTVQYHHLTLTHVVST